MSTKLLKKVNQASEILHIVSGIVVISIPVLMLLVVVIRAIVPGSVPIWSVDVGALLMWFPAYMGTGLVWRIGRHVRVQVIINKLPEKVRGIIEWINLTIALALSLIIFYAGSKEVWVSVSEFRHTYSEFPEWIFCICIPIGLAFLVYEIAVYFVKKISRVTQSSKKGV